MTWGAMESRVQNLGQGTLGELDGLPPLATTHPTGSALLRVTSD